jgi:pseudouridine synthase
VLHPRFGVEREYAVALAMPLAGEQARALNVGIKLDEGLAKLAAPVRTAPPDLVRELDAALEPRPDPSLVWYRAVLAQGWKRQLRRMFGAVDAPIVRLVRVRIGPVRLGVMPSGRARALKTPEIEALAGRAPVARKGGAGRGRNADRAPADGASADQATAGRSSAGRGSAGRGNAGGRSAGRGSPAPSRARTQPGGRPSGSRAPRPPR